MLTATDAVGAALAYPGIAPVVNLINSIRPARKALEAVAKIDADAWLPPYASRPLRKRLDLLPDETQGEPAGRTTGKIALFATCYVNNNEPGPGEDLAAVYAHNGIPVTLTPREKCCGMPRLELGDLESVRQLKDINIPLLAKLVDQGWDLTALVPSCVLMFKQELPLMFPGDSEVMKVKAAFYDPFEYLVLRAREGKLKTDFKQSLGKVALHAACHQRVQNIGPKTKDILSLVPGAEVDLIERCSGHDGTYAVKSEFSEFAMKIVKPVAARVEAAKPDHYGSDCAMAGHHIAHALGDGRAPAHPISLLRKAYGV